MSSFEWTYEMRFAVAAALGFLVGLERKSARSDPNRSYFAGERTYTLICMYGFGCAWLNHVGLEWALGVGMASITALVCAGYVGKIRHGHIGVTSEIAVLLTFIVGVLTVAADVWVAMSLAIVSTITLSEKQDLEVFVDKLERSEFLAVVKFLLVTVIILPVLPNAEFTQFHLNPARMWQIVIMVSTIGFVGYFLTKKFGARLGLWLSGMVGGIASSTAVTIAMARLAKNEPDRAGNALQASLLAGSVLYARTMVLVWIINPALLALLWWKLVILALGGVAMMFGVKHKVSDHGDSSVTSLSNPFELRPAIWFGVLFVALSAVSILAREYFGSAGLYVLSLLAGVTDITPLIISIAHQAGTVEHVAVAAIILAAMSNTLVKGAYFMFISKTHQRETAIRFGLWALLHLPLVWI